MSVQSRPNGSRIALSCWSRQFNNPGAHAPLLFTSDDRRLLSQRNPRLLGGDIDQLIALRSNAWAQDGQQFCLAVTDIEGGVHDIGTDESRVSGSKDSLLAVDPLLNLSFDDVKDLLLVGMSMEVVSACGA